MDVEFWAEIRRVRQIVGMGVKAIARRLGWRRDTVRSAVRGEVVSDL